MLQMFPGLIFLCHIYFSSPPVSTSILNMIPLPGLIPLHFIQIFSLFPLHSPFTLSKFSLLSSVFLFWVDPEGLSTDTPPHFPEIFQSFKYLLKIGKSPLFSDLLQFLFKFFPCKARTWMMPKLNLLSLPHLCHLA